ncbi:MAG: hypothetical protein ABDH21_03205 [bacterium]
MGKKVKNYTIVLLFILLYLVYSKAADITQEIQKYIDNKDYHKAIEILESKKSSLGLDYYCTMAIIYANLNKDYVPILKNAKEIFVSNVKQENQKNKNFSKILYTFGYIEYYIKQSIYNSEIYFKEAIRYDENNVKAIVAIAQVYYDKNETEKSEQMLDKAFDILKQNKQLTPEFLKIYSQVLIENKRYTKIINILKPYIDKYSIVKLFYAKALTFVDENIEANRIIVDFLRQNSDNLEAYYILGLTYKGSKAKINEGIDLIENLNPEKNDRYYLKLAQFYEGLGDVEMAINYYDKVLSMNKTNEKYYVLAITYAIDTGFTSRAINWAWEYYNMNPQNFYSNLFLAMCYEYQKQFEYSKKYYYQAIEIDPSRYEPYVRLAWIVLEQEADFNLSAEILLKGYNNVKDSYYKNRFKKALKDLVELEEEFKRRYKQKTNQEISKPIRPDLKEKIMNIIREN